MRTHVTSHRTLPLALGLVTALFIIPGVQGARTAAAARVAGRWSTPIILNVAPMMLTPARNPQLLEITGQEFQPRLILTITTPGGNTIELKDDAILQARESSFQVSALIATPGKYSLVVTNPDGGISAPFVLEARAVTKPPMPVIDRILPDYIVKGSDPQPLTVQGSNFGPGVHVTITDPVGTEVLDPIVSDLTATSFKLSVKLEMAGPYDLVVSNSTGAVSNVAVINVK